MEIERKFLVKQLPAQLDQYPYHYIEQAYLNTDPVVRIRRQDKEYYLTYKSRGMLVREEYNLPLDEVSYCHLLSKADGNIITKKRFLIPWKDKLTIELDIFENKFKDLILAEIEYPTKEAADLISVPDWFGKEVTYELNYHNSYLSRIDV